MMVGKGKEVVEKRKKEPRPLFALAFALFKRAKQKKLKTKTSQRTLPLRGSFRPDLALRA